MSIPERCAVHAGVVLHLMALGVTDAELYTLRTLVEQAYDVYACGELGPRKVFIRQVARARTARDVPTTLFGHFPIEGSPPNRRMRRANKLIYELPQSNVNTFDPWRRLFAIQSIDLNLKPG